MSDEMISWSRSSANEGLGSGANLLDLSDNDSDFIRESKKRWNNRLFVEYPGFSFVDEYIKERLRFLLELDGPWTMIKYRLFIGLKLENEIPISIVSKSNGLDDGQGREINGREQKPMLIKVGEIVDCKNGGIPVLTSVRPYLINNKTIQRRGKGLLFRSLVNRAYQVIPVLSDWEEGLSRGVVLGTPSGGVSMIQGASDAVHCITEDEAESWGQCLTGNLNDLITGFRVRLNAKTIAVVNRCNQSTKIRNVLFGPF
jgi:hypothetical protein